MCVHVCVRARVCVFECVFVHVRVCKGCVPVCVLARARARVRARVRVCARVRACACARARARAHLLHCSSGAIRAE